jgi:hypothetical protein
MPSNEPLIPAGMRQIINVMYSSWIGYNCGITGHEIKGHSELQLVGEHQEGKTNKDVHGVIFSECKLSTVPSGLSEIFPNMRVLMISYSSLCRLTRDDLKEYCKLTELILQTCSVPSLPGDLLTDLKDLQEVFLNRLDVQFIEPQILDNLKYLRNVVLSDCPNIKKGQNYFTTILEHIGCEGMVTLDEIKWQLKIAYKQYLQQKNHTMEDQEKKLLSDLKKAIQTDKDFTIVVDDEEFKAHKMILASRNSVFARMMENNPDAETLYFFDITPKIFREILNFIYTNDTPESYHIDFVQLLIASAKLDIKELGEFAAEGLAHKINDENALEMIILANKYGHMELRDVAFREIKKTVGTVEIPDNLATETEKLIEILELEKEVKEKIKAVLERGSFESPNSGD